MIHGLFGAKKNFSRVVKALGTRNHGASPHVWPHDYAVMARDTQQYLERLWRLAVLVGLFMGAKVAMVVALQRPELVERLVHVDNSPVVSALDAQFLEYLRAMCHVRLDLKLARMTSHDFLTVLDRVSRQYDPDAAVRLFLRHNLRFRTGAAAGNPLKFRVPVLAFLGANTLKGMGGWPEDEVRGKGFDGRVLVMRARQSPLVPDPTLFDAYFSCVEVFDYDCGHWLLSERPERFSVDVAQFFAK